jgi:hypothetical protein
MYKNFVIQSLLSYALFLPSVMCFLFVCAGP